MEHSAPLDTFRHLIHQRFDDFDAFTELRWSGDGIFILINWIGEDFRGSCGNVFCPMPRLGEVGLTECGKTYAWLIHQW